MTNDILACTGTQNKNNSMRDVKQASESIPTLNVNGQGDHMLNGDGDVKVSHFINGLDAEIGENVQNGNSGTQSHNHGAHDDSNGLNGSEKHETYADKNISSDSSDTISSESLDTHTKNIACDISKDNEADTPLLKDNIDTQLDSSDNRYTFAIGNEDSDNDPKTTKFDKQMHENDTQKKDKQIKYEPKDRVLKKSISRTQSCLDDPPDGGWGWVVTFSAFMVGLILDGISFSFGLFFKELYVYFNESKSVTSWIISVLNGTYLGIGRYLGLVFRVS